MPDPPPGEPALADTIAELERAWRARPLLRRVYGEWFDLIVSRLSRVEGPTVELGSGFAPLKALLPGLVATDVEPTPWADLVADAQALPWPDNSLANIIAFDVIHHLAEPARFLDEVRRTLRPGGRMIALEPYTSPLWTILYRRFHHELTDPDVDPFDADARLATRAMEGNQALPTIIFFRRDAELARRWPGLSILERRRFAFLLYPLTGGFTRRPLAPSALYRPLRALEAALAPAAPLIASRCLVVVERTA